MNVGVFYAGEGWFTGDGWSPEPPAGIQLATGPLQRPIVELPQAPVPDYTPEQLAELLALITPLRYWDSRSSRWITIDCSLAKLREYRRTYVEELQDRADEHWRSSGAYRKAVDVSVAAAREAAQDRAHARARDEARERSRNRRIAELIDYGLGVREAHAQAAREFPEE